MPIASRSRLRLSRRRPDVPRVTLWLAAGCGLLLALAPLLSDAAINTQGSPTERVQLLTFNDFHGNLEPLTVGPTDARRPIGGAAVLAAYLDQREQQAQGEVARTLRVAAGDLIGASPLVSALQRDEPTIRAMDLLELRYSSVGNHEFDRGIAELRRLQNGGCAPNTPTPDADCFPGAGFQYLAANVVDTATGQPIFPPYLVEQVRGIPIGFIGIVLKETPTIVTPTGVAGLDFLDEVETVNRYAVELRDQGVRAIVVLIHQGGVSTNRQNLAPAASPIIGLAQGFDPDVDVVVSGHTHQIYVTTIAGKLVTQAGAFGRALVDVRLTLDRATGDVTAKSAEIVDTFADVPPGNAPKPAVATFVAQAVATAAPLANRPVGTAASDITRTPNAAGESALGDLIADAQRAQLDTEVAFMNPGGIRADILAGPVTFNSVFTVQPFSNTLVRMTLTGQQIVTVLEQQFTQSPNRVLQISGLAYTWDSTRPPGDRIDPADIRVGGQPLVLTQSYDIVANNFVAAGGDNFTGFTAGTNRADTGILDRDALTDYLQTLPQPFSQTVQDRIQRR
jgi:5'-nucleotidase